MIPKFTNFVYWHDRIFGFTETGECWEFYPPDAGGPKWIFISHGPQN